MAAETKFAECDQCGMEFSYGCVRRAVCPGCGESADDGRPCSCDDCRNRDGNDGE